MKFYFEPLIDFDPNTTDRYQQQFVKFGDEIKKSWKYDLLKAGLYCSWRDMGFSIRESRDHALRYTDYFDEVL